LKKLRSFIFTVLTVLFLSQLNAYAVEQQTQVDKSKTILYKVIKGEELQKDSLSYFHHLLIMALDTTINDFGAYQFEIIDYHTPQYRTLKLLNLPDVLDITYSMTSSTREEEFIAIKVPLLNGLFGTRRLLVMKKNKASFESMSETALKSKIACQGMHWPDTKILQQNNYQVYGVIDYEANIKMLLKGRCDYFPRGIHEIDIDLTKLESLYPDIVAVDSIILKYHAPVYFFVGKHNRVLANRVQQGLEKLKANGSMRKLLLESPFSSYVNSTELTHQIKVFNLTNPI